jgi:antitoxin VapB
MALNIKSNEADRLARELAAATGESITTAVTVALAERLARVRRGPASARDAELRAIWERASKIPPIDSRSDEEILGYDDIGAFD